MKNLPEDGRGSARKRKIRVLLSTCPSDAAAELARFLVEGRHAACVNIVPAVRSVYRWEGETRDEPESLLVIKCAREDARATMEILAEKHPYDVPEVIALPVRGGYPPYLDWVAGAAEKP